MDGVDIIRIEEFRQFQKEIRGSKDHLIVGIDIAKEKHNAFFGNAFGKTLLKRLVFSNTLKGFSKLLAQVDALKVYHCLSNVVFGMEPTANYHKPLGEYLIRCNHNVVLVSGNAVAKNRELLDGRWDKHDLKDSANVADLISQGKCMFYEYPIMPLRDLRNLLSLKRRLKKQEHGLKIRIRNHLIAQYFPEMDRFFGKGGFGLSIVKWCLDPSEIAGMEFDRFVQVVAPNRRTLVQEKRLKAIWELAVESIGCSSGKALDFEAKLMVEDLQQVRESICAINKEIEDICLNFPEYSYLLTIPGFGPDVSSKVLGAIGYPFRFNSGKQILKMAGLDLNAKRSGKTSDSAVPVLSKKGNAPLRYALYQAGFVASSSNRYFKAYYINKLRGREKEKGIKTKMRVKLAAKMLIIAWTLMKKEETFNPCYLKID